MVRPLHLRFINLSWLAVCVGAVAGVCPRTDHQVVWHSHVGVRGRQEMGRTGGLRKLQEEHPHLGAFLEFNWDRIIQLVSFIRDDVNLSPGSVSYFPLVKCTLNK